MNLWVDDLRQPPGEGWVWVKTTRDAIQHLIYNAEQIPVMSLDHDLGHGFTSRKIILWCCENGRWPREVRVHSMNPVGKDWLESMIERYKDA